MLVVVLALRVGEPEDYLCPRDGRAPLARLHRTCKDMTFAYRGAYRCFSYGQRGGWPTAGSRARLCSSRVGRHLTRGVGDKVERQRYVVFNAQITHPGRVYAELAHLELGGRSSLQYVAVQRCFYIPGDGPCS